MNCPSLVHYKPSKTKGVKMISSCQHIFMNVRSFKGFSTFYPAPKFQVFFSFLMHLDPWFIPLYRRCSRDSRMDSIHSCLVISPWLLDNLIFIFIQWLLHMVGHVCYFDYLSDLHFWRVHVGNKDLENVTFWYTYKFCTYLVILKKMSFIWVLSK